MPNGFRGDAVKKYLTDIENAIDAATLVHSRDLLRGAPISRTGRPNLPEQINVKVPHPANTAHYGTNHLEIGNSNNIVVDEEQYNAVASRINNEIEGEARRVFEETIRKLEEMSETSFALPQTRIRLKFCLYQLKSSKTHQECETKMRELFPIKKEI